MGVGYAASALHRISYLDNLSDPGRPAVRGENPFWDMLLDGGERVMVPPPGPPRFSSPSKADILAWRDRVARRYRDQLGEDLFWDEDSAFERSEDAATGADTLFRYIAAALDQRGAGAVNALAGAPRPSPAEMHPIFVEAERRGFGGRFPQLLLGARYWLPFRRHLVIEEPNWRGHVERYGSLFRLADEVEEVRAAIADADPGATAWTADRPTPQDDALAAAWQASDTVARLCAAALAERLPLWTTG